MTLPQLITTSIRALRKNKGRSLLTILSIIVGIAAIIATLAIGHGAEEKMRQKIIAMGNNFVVMHAGNWLQEGKTNVTKKKRTIPLSYGDVARLKEQFSHIKQVSPTTYGSHLISYQGTNSMTRITGGNEHIIKIINRKILRGMHFSPSQIERNSRVVILGSKVAKDLFGFSDALGKKVYIEKIPFTVLGVLEKVNQHLGVRDPNLAAYIPITTMKKQIRKNPNRFLDGIVLSAHTIKQLPSLVRSIRKMFRALHRLKKNHPDDFTIFDQGSMMKAAKSSSNILNIFLMIIASISLLVGGIGIMNIMLVSVTERTKEIGIRMALGATGAHIRRQFIIEALMLCFVGGLCGTLLGILAPFIASQFTGWTVIIKPITVMSAFVITTLIGLFFGFYPAYKAAGLNPVEALLDR